MPNGGPGPVVTGELNPVFQGVYSARIELKQWMRSLECTLLSAEKLSALASWLGFPADNANLMLALGSRCSSIKRTI